MTSAFLPLLMLGACESGGDDVRIELTWSDASADLDLHVLEGPSAPLWDPNLDLHYCNRNDPPDWGPPGPRGDARSAIDDTSGLGPEVVVIDQPDAGPYPVAVHHYSRGGGTLGTTTARVRITVGEAVVHDASQPLEYNQVWTVGHIDVGSDRVESIDVEPAPSPRRQCVEN